METQNARTSSSTPAGSHNGVSHPPASATARPSPATSPPAPNPPRSPAPSRMRQRLQRHPERRLRPDRRIRKPACGAARPTPDSMCACMSISIQILSNHPRTQPCKPNHPQRRRHTAPVARRPSQAGRGSGSAGPQPRPEAPQALRGSPRTMVKNSTRVRPATCACRAMRSSRLRASGDQLPLHGLMPFRQQHASATAACSA